MRTQDIQHWFPSVMTMEGEELTSHLHDSSSQDSSPHPQDGTRRPRKKTVATTQCANEFFRDVSETGVWGRVTTQEIYLVGFLAAAIILSGLGYIVSVIIEHSATNQHQLHRSAQLVRPDPAPEDLFLNQKDLYIALRDQIMNHPHFTEVGRDKVTTNLPVEFEKLTSKDVYTTAAEWLLFSDPSVVKTNATILPRFVLAVTFFANNGAHWLSKGHWLSAADVCEWQGILCDRNHVVQVDLANNNLTGAIHSAWGMLDGCISLLLGNNALTGTVHEILATPSDLLILRLQNNRLSGSLPSSFAPSLGTCQEFLPTDPHASIFFSDADTMYLHGNDNLTGSWSDCESFDYLGVDCDRVDCECCSIARNCF